MLGALMTHGLKPGFDLFSEQGDIVFTYTFGLILSNFIICCSASCWCVSSCGR